MSRISLPLVAVGLLVLMITAPHVHMLSLATCSPHVETLTHGYGAPDYVAVDGHRILFGDLSNGALAAEQNGRVSTLLSHLNVPKGIVIEHGGWIIVAEQGANRLDRVNLRTGQRRVLLQLQNHTNRLGVNGIAPAPLGGLYIPDSSNGKLYQLDADGHLHLLASGLGRPVGAVQFHGGVAVADETAHAVWLVKHGHVRQLARLDIPDDVAVLHGRLLAVTLGDGGLWEVWPHVHGLLVGFGKPQGLAALDQDSVVVADSRRNALYRVSGLLACGG